MKSSFWKNLAKPIIGLSPMDGVTDAPFRFITAKYGHPSVIFTEFTNVEALAHGAVKALTALLYNEIERPIIAQIYGIRPESFYQACFVCAELGFDGIDINMGCPSQSVSGNGGGAGLIRTPQLAQQIIRTCRQATEDWASGKTIYQAQVHRDIIDYIEKTQAGAPPSTEFAPARPHQNKKFHASLARPPFQPQRKLLPISVKTRLGYETPSTREWIKILLAGQPDNISLHGRTLKQMYSGEADWEQIALAAQLVHQENPAITLLGNGDVQSQQDALEKIAQFKVDGVLIGRASFGNPGVFNNTAQAPLERLEIAIEHTRLHEEIFGQNSRAFAPMKKNLGWYASDFPHAKDLRVKLIHCNSAQEVENLIATVQTELNSLPPHPLNTN